VTADGTFQSETTIFTHDTSNVKLEWNYTDPELLSQDIIDNIEYMALAVGSYPYGDDVQAVSFRNISFQQEDNIALGDVALQPGIMYTYQHEP